MPFDRAWFGGIVPASDRDPCRASPHAATAAPTPTPEPPARAARRASWGEAPDVVGFVGRATEREMLRRWVLDERCRRRRRARAGRDRKVAAGDSPGPRPRAVIRVRLLAQPARCADTGRVAGGGARVPRARRGARSGGESAALRRLLELLSEARCLLVLDNVETVLQPGGPVGAYRAGYERYGTLLRQVGEAPHGAASS